MADYGRNFGLETDIYEHLSESIGKSYGIVDTEALDHLDEHYERLDPEEFVGGQASVDSGVVYFDPENGKAAYMEIKSRNGEVAYVDTRYFGDEEGVINTLLEEPTEQVMLEDAATGEEDISLSAGPVETAAFDPGDDTRGRARHGRFDRVD